MKRLLLLVFLASPCFAQGHSVTLTWTPPPAVNPPVTSYELVRTSDVDCQITMGIPSPTYTDTSVISGRTYTYAVMAVNAQGISLASNLAVAVIP
jgi:hypothetical protein